MAAPTSTVKEQLHQIVDGLDARTAIRLLAMVSLWDDDGELTPEEEEEVLKSLAEAEAGDYVTQEEWEREIGLRK